MMLRLRLKTPITHCWLARVLVGQRLVQLQMTLAERVNELEEALTQVKTLSGLLPICFRCKSIRDDQGYWNRLEAYVAHRTSAQFTHGICPGCAKALNDEVDWDALKKAGDARRQRSGTPPAG